MDTQFKIKRSKQHFRRKHMYMFFLKTYTCHHPWTHAHVSPDKVLAQVWLAPICWTSEVKYACIFEVID